MPDPTDGKDLSRLYKLLAWPDNPFTPEGARRYRLALDEFKRLMEHEWLKNLSNRPQVEILELCAGRGIGGTALAKILENQGIKVGLTLTDLRGQALEDGKKFARNMIKGRVEAMVLDAAEAYKLRKAFDIILIHGFSTPHFSPWSMVRVLAATAALSADDSLIIIQEADRRYTVFYQRGYRDLLIEKKDAERIILSVHAGYNPLTGTFNRTYLVLGGQEKLSRPVSYDMYFWGIAELRALLWTFYQKVDFVKIDPVGPYTMTYFVLGFKPRRRLTPEDFEEMPS